MSFQNKSFWMPRDAACLTDGEIGYDNSSRMEPKRGHQWFMDTTAPELFSNKKQAIESVSNRSVLGTSHMNATPWHNTSGFQSVSGQSSDRLFGSETVRAFNASVGAGNLDMGRKDFNDQYGTNASVGLSMSHTIEDPSGCISFGGIRKVKVNQVRDASNDLSASMGHSYGRGDNIISMGASHTRTDSNPISLGLTYNSGDGDTNSIGTTFSTADSHFISMGHTFNKGNSNFISMGLNYDKGDGNILSMGQPFDKGDANFITMGPSYEKGDDNVISMAPSYSKEHENFISMVPAYDKANDSFISMGHSYGKGDDDVISFVPNCDKDDSDIASMGPAKDKGDPSILSMHHKYNKGDGNAISLGGFHDEAEMNPSGSVVSRYDVLMSNQNSSQLSEVPSQNDLAQSNADTIGNKTPKANSKTDTASKNKEPRAPKKASANNNFPANVKSLLITGMLDGVPVKYVSWSREKSLKATIKGTGYLCSCDKCNFSKTLNAYEFERHANCKTKHPNNHIYFDNGKTIYAVVQELKNTPQEMLFDAIQNVTGSEINQKNFEIWKESYKAATIELQRIYGKDEVVMPS